MSATVRILLAVLIAISCIALGTTLSVLTGNSIFSVLFGSIGGSAAMLFWLFYRRP